VLGLDAPFAAAELGRFPAFFKFFDGRRQPLSPWRRVLPRRPERVNAASVDLMS
jgi:hypothetical protein